MKFIKKQGLQFALILLFCIVSFRFYNYIGFSNTVQKMPQFAAIALMVVYCYKELFSSGNKTSLFRVMQWIVFSLFISIFSAWIFWDQSPIQGYLTSSIMLTYVFFFYLYKTRPSVQLLETLILTLGFLYAILWIYAFTQIPFVVFGYDLNDGLVNMDESRGMIRIKFVGQISLILTYFLAVNKFYITKNKIFIAIAAFLFVILVFQLTRQLILWTAVVTLIYMYLKNRKIVMMIGAVAAVVLVSLGNIKFSNDNVIGALINQTQQQFETNNMSGEEDIRITEYKYFFFDWSKNIVTDLIGNGMPHGNSSYGRYYISLVDYKKLYLSDVGYAMMFVVQGLLGLFLYIILFIKCVRFQMPADLDYVRMFMLFMIPANIAASWFSGADSIISICICVYLIMQYGRRSNGKILADSTSSYKYIRPKFTLK